MQKVSRYVQTLSIVVTSLSIVTLAGFFSSNSLPGDICSHFRVQYLLLSLILLPLVLRHRLMIPVVVLVIVNSGCVLPLYIPKDKLPRNSNAELKLLQVNINSANKRTELIEALLKEENADLVFMQEVNPLVARFLRDYKAYPYKLVKGRDDNFGIALLSKTPLTDCTFNDFSGGHNLPTITADTLLDGKSIHLICTHPLPPLSQFTYDSRNIQMASILRHIKARNNSGDGETILGGDLNNSFFSQNFQNFLHQAALRDSELSFGFQPSWPTYFLPLSIAIDHVLFSSGYQVVSRKVGESVGSDHYPLTVVLQRVKD